MSNHSWLISTTVIVGWFAGNTCKITINSIPNSFNYCVICTVHIRILGRITQPGGQCVGDPEEPVRTLYQILLPATLLYWIINLYCCEHARQTNGPILTKAYARIMRSYKIKCHVVWH
jgi:hypothetical protein